MTSKSSFWVNLKENNKRRLWVWVISVLGFMLVFPVATAITISQIINSAAYLFDSYSSEVAEEILHAWLIAGMQEQLWVIIKMVAVAVIATISAVQGFSYLYSRKKMDFYMGMPIKRKKRFLIIWLNGILLYVVPALLGLLIEMLIAAGNGALDGTVVCSAAYAFLANFWFYLGVYHMALLAVMMTGNVIITGFGILVFTLYEFVVRWLLDGYCYYFFHNYSYYNTRTEPILSPYAIYISLANAFMNENKIDIKSLGGLILFSAITGVLVYTCYIRRPAEAAGKAMTFSVTRPIIKILLTVPASLLAGIMIGEMGGYNPLTSSEGEGYMIFAMLLMVVIGSGVIQVIYEFDLKGALHKKLQIIISGVFAALLFLVFRYDLLGYDAYVPKPEQVESIAFIPEAYEQNRGSAYFDEEGNYLSEIGYADRYMYLYDVEDVCELAEHSIEEYDKILAEFQKNHDEEKTGRWSQSTLIYRLKNGKKVCRKLHVNVDDEQTIALLDNIIGSEEFKEGYMAGASERLKSLLSENEHYKIKAGYGNMIYWKDMSRTEAVELLEIYQRELAYANFSNIRENVPEGMMQFQISEEIRGSREAYYGAYGRGTRNWYININIYPFYEECLNYLKEHGCYMDYQLNMEDVAYIQVMNRNTESYQRLRQENQSLSQDLAVGAEAVSVVDSFDEEIDTRVYAEYSGREEIEQIAASCYPQDFIDSYAWDRGLELDNEYTVYVYFNTDSPLTKSYGTSASYGFLKGQIPEFVMKDTIYQE